MKRLFNITVFLCLLLVSQTQAQQTYTLEDCRKMAIEKNKDLLISKEKVKAAKNMEKAARTQYLPNFSAKGAYMYNSRNLSLLSEDQFLPIGTKMSDGSFGFRQDQVNNSWTMINGQPTPLDASGNPFNPKTNPEKIEWKDYTYIPKSEFEINIENVFVGTIMATQPIYLGGKIRELNKIANASKKISESQEDNELSETLIKIDEDYWRVVSLSSKKELADSYVKLLEKLDTDLQNSISIGVATKAEGLTVKVKLNEAQMTLSQVEDGLSLSRMSLAQVCGLDYSTPFSLADEKTVLIVDVTLSNPDVNANEAISNRSEVKSLEQLVNIAQSKEKIEFSRFLPSIVATGGYMISNPNMFNGIDNSFAGMWNVGVVVDIPLFHWGEKINTLNAAKSEKLIAQYKLDDAKEKIELQIKQSTYKIVEANKKLIVVESNMKRAEENLRYANIGFEAGTIPSTNVIEAQTAWLKANSEKIDAQIDVKLCDVYLKKATGQLK
jgi:outer membrane protein TolC